MLNLLRGSTDLQGYVTWLCKINCWVPSKIEWDLTNGPISKLLELLDTQV